MLRLEKIALNIVLWSSLLFSFLTASASNFINTWDEVYNESQIPLDSFLIKNERGFLQLEDFPKFQVIFYHQELNRYIDNKNEIDNKYLESISNENLKFLLKVHRKIFQGEDISAALLERVLLLAKSRFSTHYDGIVNLILSEIYFIQGNVGLSLDYSDRAINRGKLGDYRNLLGASFLHKSNIYFTENLNERAYANSQKGLFYAKRFKSIVWQVLLNQKLGEIQFDIQNYSIAKDHWENGYILAENKVHELIFARLTRQLAHAYFNIENYTTASELVNDALIVFYRQESEIEIGKAHFLYGQVLNALKDYSLAEQNFKLSISYVGDNDILLGEIYAALASLYLERNQYKKALEFVNKSIEVSLEGTSDYYELVYLKADIYKGLKNTKKSSELYKNYITARDSIKKEELQNRIAELNSLFRSEQRERKIIEQQKVLDEQESEILINIQTLENDQLRIRQLFILIVFIILLFIVIISLISLRSKQNKLKQEHKSSELKQTLLRSQMNPHFIFNSFSIIQSYIYENDKEASSQFLVNFSRLIRMILENSDKELIPLSEEIDILKRYLYVQKIRFEDRFLYKIEVGEDLESDLQQIEIPPMIAQPFIENAIEHGDLQHSKQGLITIKLQRKGALIELVIEDNGIGIKAGRKKNNKKHKSMATEITEERIKLLNRKYGVNGFLQIMDLSDINEQGTRVVIQIPFKKIVRTIAH